MLCPAPNPILLLGARQDFSPSANGLIHCRWPSTYQRIMRMGTVTVTLGSQARLCFCCKLAEASLEVNFPTKTQLSGTSSDQKHASQRILLQLLAILHQQMQGGCKETRLCWAEECLRNCDILAHSRTYFMSTRTRRSPVSEAGRIPSYSIQLAFQLSRHHGRDDAGTVQ